MALKNLGFRASETTDYEVGPQVVRRRSGHMRHLDEFLEQYNWHVLERFTRLGNDDAVIAVDLNIKITFVNSIAGQRIFKEIGVLGLSLKDVLQVEDTNGRPSSWDQMLGMGLLVGSRFGRCVRVPNGMRLPSWIIGCPIFSEKGELVGSAILIKPRQPENSHAIGAKYMLSKRDNMMLFPAK